MKQKTERKERIFLWALALLAAANYFRFFEKTITGYNTTLFAMSYRYGFISRGMLGTIWAGLDMLLPWDLMTYEAVYFFSLICTAVFYVLLFGLFATILRLSPKDALHNMYYLIAFVSIFAFSMFLTDEVFGRLDLYLYLLTFWAMLLLLKQKREWLIVPLCILCMCIHQGYIFTCANLVVVLLLYRMLTETGQARKKYVTLTVVLLAVMAVLFVYFEFFSHAAGEEIYDQVVAAAKALSEDGKSYNKSVINHEILGKDVFEDEMEMHQINYQEFPVFLVLFLPYILLAIHFFRGLLGSDTGVGKVGFRVMLRGWVQRWKEDKPLPEAAHVLVLLGGAAVVPQMILKVDYGRYVFMTFTYYIFMVMCLIALGDRRLEAQLQKTKEAIKGRTPFPLAVLLYPMFFMPLHDVVISGAAYRVSTWVVGLFSRF